MMNKKKKYLALFLVREQGTFELSKVRRFKPSEKVVRYEKDIALPIDVSKPTYSKGLKLFYLIDIKAGQLNFGKGTSEVDFTTIDRILKQSLAKQLTSNLAEKFSASRLIDIGLALAGGIGLGMVIGGYI